jgi:hypothetical protein
VPNKHKTLTISWHSADPSLKPWIEQEAERYGITRRELLDKALAEFRARRELSPEIAAPEAMEPG